MWHTIQKLIKKVLVFSFVKMSLKKMQDIEVKIQKGFFFTPGINYLKNIFPFFTTKVFTNFVDFNIRRVSPIHI